jgi:predicted AAA+ superfamily ATPase
MNYIETYVQRDVLEIINPQNIDKFIMLTRLLAGRTGQILNISSIASDTGISNQTIENWLSILESSYIIFRQLPFYNNFGKRLIKSPKIHFYDSGLVCSLLGIQTKEQLTVHPLAGSIFESMVISDFKKTLGSRDLLYYIRDNTGSEIDLLVETSTGISSYEIKLSKTIRTDFAKYLKLYKRLSNNTFKDLNVIYGGNENLNGSEFNFVSWSTL